MRASEIRIECDSAGRRVNMTERGPLWLARAGLYRTRALTYVGGGPGDTQECRGLKRLTETYIYPYSNANRFQRNRRARVRSESESKSETNGRTASISETESRRGSQRYTERAQSEPESEPGRAMASVCALRAPSDLGDSLAREEPFDEPYRSFHFWAACPPARSFQWPKDIGTRRGRPRRRRRRQDGDRNSIRPSKKVRAAGRFCQRPLVSIRSARMRLV